MCVSGFKNGVYAKIAAFIQGFFVFTLLSSLPVPRIACHECVSILGGEGRWLMVAVLIDQTWRALWFNRSWMPLP